MILADKIIALRKKNGWSQEELAEKLNVSRQSVSKWEGAQSTPDLERVLQMAKLFGVTTDYLLREELEDSTDNNDTPAAEEDTSALRRVSMEEAHAYLGTLQKYSGISAWAIAMYVLSPVLLLTLSGLAEGGFLSEQLAVGIGVTGLLILVAAATALLVYIGSAEEPYEYLEREDIDTEYGVAGMVRERRKQHDTTYRNGNMLGVALCILAAVPVICYMLFSESPAVNGAQVYWVVSGSLGGAAVSATLVMVAFAVQCFTRNGILRGGFDRLLEEGDYTRQKKYRRRTSRLGDASGIYWLVITAVYLAISFLSDSWDRSWVIWPVAGVLFAAFAALWEMMESRKIEK
ncbi:MAG: helix-turn-helix transcriptional regulator [Clostridia bacterium]|nr:helix-turn-helix transcriptional regulator [Clostridia bacterium]